MKLKYTFPFLSKPIDIFFKDTRFIKEILLDGEYKYLFHYPVVIDIGANIGTFSIYMYDRANEIYAIEPVSECLDCFRQTIEANKLDKIKVYEEAIAGNTGTRDIRMKGHPTDGAWTITDATGSPHEYRKVKAITLKEFMDRENIFFADLVKIDVEGAEREILSDPTFPKDRIGTIIGEFHDSNLKEWFKDLLESKGFVYYERLQNHFLARKK